MAGLRKAIVTAVGINEKVTRGQDQERAEDKPHEKTSGKP
jgi:hypothetical protein